MSQVPAEERIGELTVYHPRYLLLPKVSMAWHGLAMYLGSLTIARRLHAQIGFDCVDAHYIYPDGLAAVLLGRRLGIPVVVSARGTDINVFSSFPLIRPQIRWTLKRAAGVIAVCRGLKDRMVKLGILPDRIEVIGNGVDTERFRPVDQRKARHELCLPIEGRVIVSVGALVPVKRHRSLILAMAEIAPRHPNLRLCIVGEGSLRRELVELTRHLGIEDRVQLVGSKPNEALGTWYGAADVSCLVSRSEGWANVLLESMACGTPVVVTRVGGAEEVVKSPNLGVLVEPDVQSIVSGLELALQRTWDRNELVRYAQSRTWDVVAQEVESYLESRVVSRGTLVSRLSDVSGRPNAR